MSKFDKYFNLSDNYKYPAQKYEAEQNNEKRKEGYIAALKWLLEQTEEESLARLIRKELEAL